MQYRTFGKLDWKPSALGFGAMRLPIIDDDSSKIDEPEAMKMIRYAIDHGVNYVDTAYPYHQEQSEPFVGRVLQDGYREKVKLATKMPSWLVKSPDDFDRLLDTQLERLQTDHIDFYLLHALNKNYWSSLCSHGVLDWAERAMGDGRIRHLGFSFHDNYETFQKIVDGYDKWTFCQIQYNYMDIEHQAGERGLKYAADKGLAVVIMEPLLGGRLAMDPPAPVAKVWESAPRPFNNVEWALHWLWNQPEVSLLLSGMSTMQHVVDNVAYADTSGTGKLTDEDLATIDQAREAYQSLSQIPCTACEYCLPCPNGVSIPEIFRIYNQAKMHEDVHGARTAYSFLAEEARAHQCLECGECEAACPQNITIIEWLKKVRELFEVEA